MKKAKIVLALVAILAVVGGALAFRASRLPANVFTLLAGSKVSSITVNGVIYTTTIPNCTTTNLRSTLGLAVDVKSTTTDPATTTRFISGSNFIVATYPYCTLWHTATVTADE